MREFYDESSSAAAAADDDADDDDAADAKADAARLVNAVEMAQLLIDCGFIKGTYDVHLQQRNRSDWSSPIYVIAGRGYTSAASGQRNLGAGPLVLLSSLVSLVIRVILEDEFGTSRDCVLCGREMDFGASDRLAQGCNGNCDFAPDAGHHPCDRDTLSCLAIGLRHARACNERMAVQQVLEGLSDTQNLLAQVEDNTLVWVAEEKCDMTNMLTVAFIADDDSDDGGGKPEG